MNKTASLLKPLMPIIAAAYGTALIYVTALPIDSNSQAFGGELLSWLLTLVGIGLTLFLVQRIEPKLFPTAKQFQIKSPTSLVIVGLLLVAPLLFVAKEYIVYGLTWLVHPVRTCCPVFMPCYWPQYSKNCASGKWLFHLSDAEGLRW